MEYTDEFLAYLELREDLFFEKIAQQDCLPGIQTAFNVAKEFYEAHKTMTIEACLEAENIKVEYLDHDGDFFKVKFRAQYEHNPKGQDTIFVYMKSIAELADKTGFDQDQLVLMCLSHEFFHYLERKHQRIVSDMLPEVVTTSFLGFKRKAHILRYSEIGAHRFAQLWCQFEHLANYVDILYLLKTNKLSESQLSNFYQAFTHLA